MDENAQSWSLDDQMFDEAFHMEDNGNDTFLPHTNEGQEYTMEHLFVNEEEALNLPAAAEDAVDLDDIHDLIADLDNIKIAVLALGIEIDRIELGLHHLGNVDANLQQLIGQHLIILPVVVDNMTIFQRIAKAVIELVSAPATKATIYQALEGLCGGPVNLYSLRQASHHQLTTIGVRSRREANVVLVMSRYYQEDHGFSILDCYQNKTDQALFDEICKLVGINPYMALTVIVFGFGKTDFWPVYDRDFRMALNRYFNQQLDLPLWTDEARAAVEAWAPFKGLAAWLIWTS